MGKTIWLEKCNVCSLRAKQEVIRPIELDDRGHQESCAAARCPECGNEIWLLVRRSVFEEMRRMLLRLTWDEITQSHGLERELQDILDRASGERGDEIGSNVESGAPYDPEVR